MRLESPNYKKGRCIYCGGSGMSKEHVISEWVGKMFGKPAPAHTKQVVDSSKLATGQVVYRPAIKVRQGHSSNEKVRVVCRKCNSGWLSGIDERSKPGLIQLARGSTGDISAEQQRNIAAWIAKVACAHEFAQAGQSLTITPAEREYLMHNLCPPPNWRVWIGQLPPASVWDFALYGQSIGVGEGTGVPNTLATAGGIGRLFFLVLSSTSPEVDLDSVITPVDGLVRIWPEIGSSIPWPPVVMLDDKSAERAAMILQDAIDGAGGEWPMPAPLSIGLT